MNTIKPLFFLLFVAFVKANECQIHHQKLIDPWGPAREACRKETGYSRVQLLEARHDLRKIDDFLICLGFKLGVLNEDGTINRKVLIRKIAPLQPVSIAKPIMDCCIDEVYGDKKPRRHEFGIRLADWAACAKNKTPPEIWSIIGILGPPVYEPLEHCHESH